MIGSMRVGRRGSESASGILSLARRFPLPSPIPAWRLVQSSQNNSFINHPRLDISKSQRNFPAAEPFSEKASL
jgi:hypothetical protein